MLDLQRQPYLAFPASSGSLEMAEAELPQGAEIFRGNWSALGWEGQWLPHHSDGLCT